MKKTIALIAVFGILALAFWGCNEKNVTEPASENSAAASDDKHGSEDTAEQSAAETTAPDESSAESEEPKTSVEFTAKAKRFNHFDDVNYFKDDTTLLLTAAELDSFRENVMYDDEYYRDDALAEALSAYDEAFFETHDLLIVDVELHSGSIIASVKDVYITESEGSRILNVLIDEHYPYAEYDPETSMWEVLVTDDMAQWFLFVELDKDCDAGNATLNFITSESFGEEQ